jgi:hypothetical protein
MAKIVNSETPWQEEEREQDTGMKEERPESPEQDTDLPTPPPFCSTPMMEKRLERFREWAKDHLRKKSE